MAVLLKPNGMFGAAYMAVIKPFRYVIVYPALMRQIGQEWRAGPAIVAEVRLMHQKGSRRLLVAEQGPKGMAE